MRYIIILLVLSLAYSCKDDADPEPQDIDPEVFSSISLDLDNILSNDGHILAALYNDPVNWELDIDSETPDQQLQIFKISASSGSLELRFDSLDAGTYAISIFHDINDNSILDKDVVLNTFPQEPYAFSIAEGPFFSSPDFIDCSFQLEEDSDLIISAELIHP